MFEWTPLKVSNQVWYSGAGNVAPAPWSVRVAVAGSGQVTAACEGATDPDAGAACDSAGWLAAGGWLAALGLGVAPVELQAPKTNNDAATSAARRFEPRTVTRKTSSRPLGTRQISP